MHVPSTEIRPRLEILAKAAVPTTYGTFDMAVFHWGGDQTASGLSPDHVALTMGGDLSGRENVLVRIHSECLTSEVFGSLKCDCREQLQSAQAEIGRKGEGLVLYLRQEGRGIGLTNKLRAYQLQSVGHDTVDANRLLGLPDDARDYGAAAAMLEHLGVRSIRLMTNNPLKVQAMRALGVQVNARVAHVIEANQHSVGYLEAKRLRMGHTLPSADELFVPDAE
jgi:GTP cyclohydrolase II